MKLYEITQALEHIAPLALQEDYDNSGLIVGHRDQEIEKALICLDSTEAVVDEAIELGCQLVVAHHPIIFRGLKRFNGANYVERAVEKAIRHGIAIYACHTNLDNVLHQGVNSKIAAKLGLSNTRILRPVSGKLLKLVVFVPDPQAEAVRNALFAAGAGDIGNYSECSFSASGNGTFKANEGANPFVGSVNARHTEAEQRLEVILPDYASGTVVKALLASHPYEEVAYDLYALNNTWNQAGSGLVGSLPNALSQTEFLNLLKGAMELPLVRFTHADQKLIERVAICGGAGSFLVKDAIRSGAQAFVTADLKYHEFFDAENRLMVCDIGHYESEKYTMQLFAEILSQKFPNFATIFAKTPTNPVNYYF